MDVHAGGQIMRRSQADSLGSVGSWSQVCASRGPAGGEWRGEWVSRSGSWATLSQKLVTAGVADAQLTKFDLLFAPGVKLGCGNEKLRLELKYFIS